jgi:hypothetical protein
MTDDRQCLVKPLGNISQGAKLLRTEAKMGKTLFVFLAFTEACMSLQRLRSSCGILMTNY